MKVTFEIAKKAQDNGFPQNGKSWFVNGKLTTPSFALGSYLDYGNRYVYCPDEDVLGAWFRNVHKINILPMPITGAKNGYDSYPIIGWYCEILTPYKDDVNSYYMGYPVLDWFVMDRIEEGEKLDDYVKKFDSYEEALENGLINAFNHIKK